MTTFNTIWIKAGNLLIYTLVLDVKTLHFKLDWKVKTLAQASTQTRNIKKHFIQIWEIR